MRFHAVDLPAEKLDAVEAEAGNVFDDLLDRGRIGEPHRAGPWRIPHGHVMPVWPTRIFSARCA
jgi:hypothetical protein